MNQNPLENFVSSMMTMRLYVPKKQKHSYKFTIDLVKKAEDEIEDKTSVWFSRMSFYNDIPEDQVKEYAIQKCVEEHLRLCDKEKK